MKRLRIISIIIPMLLAMGLIAGCGGGASKVQSGETPWGGSLRGVATSPVDGDMAVPTYAWIHIYWPDENYPPPNRFTMVLEKGQSGDRWGRVHTTYSKEDSSPIGGSWWYEPYNNLSPDTWYRIVLTNPDRRSERVEVYFYTGAYYGVQPLNALSTGKSYRPEGATKAVGEPAESHTVDTKSQ
ncbi:MAG: hypothetical protein GX139_02670 [Armatimonadetes bacterium]|jgi:hypothetical protein|nr:hypothetical protein [Armatimonadota bacterium]